MLCAHAACVPRTPCRARAAPQVSKLIHDLIGGEVEHCTPSHPESPEEEELQMLSRLKAMTLMQQDGWTPQVRRSLVD